MNSYSTKLEAVKCLIYCCGSEGHYLEHSLSSLSFDNDDVDLISALYSAGIPHDIIGRAGGGGGVSTEDLERLVMNCSLDNSLLLCWSMCVASNGCETPLAIEMLLGYGWEICFFL